MGLKFWHRGKIERGATLHLIQSDATLRFGKKGARYTVGPKGRRVGIGSPDSGVFYTTAPGGEPGEKKATPPELRPSTDARLDLGFFDRLLIGDEEEAFVAGLRALVRGRESEALARLREASHIPDGAFLAGVLALKHAYLDDGSAFLEQAEKGCRKLGRRFRKYGIRALLTLPITQRISAHIEPGTRGVLLAQVEVAQRQGRRDLAVSMLRRLRRISPDDVVAKLSLAEILLLARGDRRAFHEVVKLGSHLENDSLVHTALLLYKAMALRQLKLLTAARDTLTAILRRKKARPPEIQREAFRERAQTHLELGDVAKAKKDFLSAENVTAS